MFRAKILQLQTFVHKHFCLQMWSNYCPQSKGLLYLVVFLCFSLSPHHLPTSHLMHPTSPLLYPNPTSDQLTQNLTPPYLYFILTHIHPLPDCPLLPNHTPTSQPHQNYHPNLNYLASNLTSFQPPLIFPPSSF